MSVPCFPKPARRAIVRWFAGLALVIAGITLLSRAGAQEPLETQSPNEACIACHGNPGLKISFMSGETVDLATNLKEYSESIHGRLGLYCTACHRDVTGFPHPPVNASTRREFSLRMFPLCAECHEDKYRETAGSVHRLAMDHGNLDAAECVDCHGSHNIAAGAQNRTEVAQSCRKCHSEIYDLYKESVHGAALLDEENPDVPSCIDCHGAHKIEGPSNEPFHLFSPRICARCHTNEMLMNRYGLSTDVIATYVSDFHGTTVTLFQATAPGQVTDKPVCIDCHGVHDIRKTNDPESTVIKQNLLATCRKCHPNATASFPGAWLSHYRPSLQHYPIVFIVKWFYLIIIPLILGGMAIFVFFDYMRQIVGRMRGKRNA